MRTLRKRAGAELHDLGIRAHQRGDLGGMARQQRSLGAGLVIFRQGADRVEQLRAFRVVEIFAGDFLGRACAGPRSAGASAKLFARGGAAGLQRVRA